MNLFFCLQGKKYVILPSVIFMLFIGTDKMFCFRNKKVWNIAFAIFLLLAGVGAVCISIVCQKPNTSPNTLYIYIDADDDEDSVAVKLGQPFGWDVLTMGGYNVLTGRYAIQPGEKILPVYQRLRRGQQEPVRLAVPSVRTMRQLGIFLGKNLMMDSTEVIRQFTDSTFCASYGYTLHTLPALFIPNTYEIYWNTSLPNFMKRMLREHEAFWNAERQRRADSLSLTRIEVSTLASIIDEETANNAEKPMVAGMYLNRLRIGMPLQADPTVKFALGNFGARRIYHSFLEVESPYNTYKHKGLPPGPIRIPSIMGIDAVLHGVHHGYLYMCAKEDFSGTHNFARTYAQHLANARRYTRALNARKIK